MISRRRGRLPRAERAAQARRERALAHLRRVRSRAGAGPRRRSAWRGRAALLAVSAAVGLLLGGPLLRLAAHATRVDSIHVRGARQLTPEAVVRATGLAAGAALASVDAAGVAARVAQLPWIAKARAVRLPLGPVVVGIEERVAVALARAGAEAAFVDATGTAFAAADADADAALPQLVVADALELGRPDPRLIAALELAYRLPELGLALPSEVRVAADGDPEGLSLRLPGLAARIVLGREDREARLADLARLLSAGLPEVGSAESLDLRIADRVVLRSPPSPGGAAQAAPTRGDAAASGTRPSG